MGISGIGGGLQNFNIGGNADSPGTNGLGGMGTPKAGYKSSPQECETCKNRKYQDGSDENVSFKSPTHVSPQASAGAVRAHEQEHVSNAYLKAREQGGRVLSVGVSIHTAVCPECGSVYTAGGLTTSIIATPKDDGKKNPYDQMKDGLAAIMNTGIRTDKTV